MVLVYILIGLFSFSLIFPLSYIFFAWFFTLIPSNLRKKNHKGKIPIYLFSNGAHTDICLPIKHDLFDWSYFIESKDFKENDSPYIAFGWGDKGFYMETPSWAELKFKTAFKALFKLGSSVMQVVLYDKVPKEEKWFRSLEVNTYQYLRLIRYIQNSFDLDDKQKPKAIPFEGMPCYEHLNYNFYEGKGQYHFFNTCNCWVNRALKDMNIKTATWAPFAKCIFHYKHTFYTTE